MLSQFFDRRFQELLDQSEYLELDALDTWLHAARTILKLYRILLLSEAEAEMMLVAANSLGGRSKTTTRLKRGGSADFKSLEQKAQTLEEVYTSLADRD